MPVRAPHSVESDFSSATENAMKRAAGVDNTSRRTWDKSFYGRKAAEKEEKEKRDQETPLEAKRRKRLEKDPLHQGLILQRANLKPREHRLDLASRIGKTQVITVNTPLNQQAGYYCSTCDVMLHDSMSYLDHINGKWHNRALGMSMRVERSTVEQVKARLEKHKKKKLMHKHPKEREGGTLLEYKEEDLPKSDEPDKDDSNKAEEEVEDSGLDSDAAALMGFSGFGTTKGS